MREAACESGTACPAGLWPDPDRGGVCSPAGLAAPLAPRWCEGDLGSAECAASECPAGQYRSDGKCAPAGVPWTCPPGFVSAPQGQQGCVADVKACPAGAWPVGLPKNAVFVDAAAGSAGNGTLSSPYKSLYAAATKAPVGSTLAVAAGDYVEQLPAKTALTVVGVCAAKVRIVAPNASASSVLVTGGKFALRGVTVTGPGPGIVAFGGTLDLADLWFDAPTEHALLVQGKGVELALTRAAVRGVVAGNKKIGNSLGLSEATATLTDVAIDGGRVVGVGAVNGAQVAATHLRIRDIDVDLPEGKYGSAVSAATGAVVTVIGGDFEGASDSAVHAAAELTRIELAGVRIGKQRGFANKQTEGGYGVLCEWGATMALRGCVIENARAVGVLVSAEGAQATLLGTIVRDMQLMADGSLGWAAFATKGAVLDIADSLVVRAAGVGLHVRDAGSRMTARRTAIQDTLADKKLGKAGVGAATQFGGDLRLFGCHLTGGRFGGVVAAGAGTTAHLAGCVIEDTLAQPASGQLGQGAIVLNGADALITGSKILRNREGGLAVTGAGARILVAGSVIADTRPREDPAVFGQGVVVRDGGHAELTNSRISGNHLAAVAVHKGSLLTRGCVLAQSLAANWADDTGKLGKAYADGLVAFEATQVTVLDTLVTGHPRAGLLFDHCAAVLVAGSAALGNGLGLVQQRMDAPVLPKASLFAGNSDQNRATDKGLDVPAPPPVGNLSL